MALVLSEKVGSRVRELGPTPTVEFHYILTGTADDQVAERYVRRKTAKVYEGMTRKVIDLTPDWVDTETDTGQWQVIVNYDTLQDPFNLGDFAENFDISLATEHITHSKATIGEWRGGATQPEGGVTPTNNQALNDTGDRIEGLDILAPLFRFDETHRKSTNLVTRGYVGALFNLSRKVNNAFFKGFDPGECMFLGARGRLVEDGVYEVHYRFAATPNRTNIQVGHITVPFKRGWDYIWVETEWKEITIGSGQDAQKKMTHSPLAVRVERVYDDGNFSRLKIGTS